MTKDILNVVFVGGYCFAAVVSCSAQTPSETSSQSGHNALLNWAREQAVVLNTIEPGSDESDLQAFKQLVGDARIVFLGDSRHDAREQWMLKHRLIEYLVNNMGFTVLAMEESLPCTSPLNAFLLGERDDLDQVLSEMGSWYIWDTVELQALMISLRAHNEKATSGPGVRVYGFDSSDGARQGVEFSLAFLAKADPETAERLRSAIDLAPFRVDFWPQTMQKYGDLAAGAVDSLGVGLTSLVGALIERRDGLVAQGGEAEYEWALRHAIVARQAHHMMLSLIHDSFEDAATTREVAMADNLSWLLRVAAPGERIIVWAHNFHVARAAQHLEIPGRPPATMDPLGHLLDKEFGGSMISIGFSFDRGVDSTGLMSAPEGWVDNLMAAVGPDAFLLDLRTAPPGSAARAWLEAEQTMRGEGGMATLAPAKAFDAIAFIRGVGQVTRTARAGARRAALDGQ
ncbi:MAG: erythromycin esterase family protein [Gemmatimonadetes bacterium]|jgi:erythromycin esterase|nr:erythromycin esterase family protein [Gemmatimonadota bacterium]